MELCCIRFFWINCVMHKMQGQKISLLISGALAIRPLSIFRIKVL